MGTIETLLRVKADASQAVSGLKPLQASLDKTSASAKSTETALKGLDGTHNVTLNDQAILNAQAEVNKLRADMRRQLEVDVNADTRPAQTRIRQLQSSIKTLQQEDHEIQVDVAVNESVTGSLSRGTLAGLAQGAASAGLSALPGKLGAVTGAARAAGPAMEEAGAAFLGLDLAAGTVATGGLILIPVVLGALAAAAVDIGFKLAGPAADIESLQIQLNSLTGGKGTETLAFLQQWAKETPFALNDAIQSFKLLSAAGVPLNQMKDDLDALGNVASATGTNLGALTLPISQMISVGKASFENIQQLVELSGAPAWQILADNMGLTVAQVQQLASEGKLGADTIQLLIDKLGQKWPTAMDDQAKSLNGQLSSLQDTFTQVKQTLSSVFLPAMEQITPVIQDVADIVQDLAILWVAAVKKMTDNPIAESLFLPFKLGADVIGFTADKLDDVTKSISGTNSASDDFVKGGVKVVTVSLKEDLIPTVKEANQAYKDLLDSFTALNNGFINSRSALADYDAALDTLVASLKEGGDTFAPDTEKGRANWENLVAVAESANTRITNALKHRGTDAANTVYQNSRQTLHRLLTDAGVQSDRAWTLVNNVLKKPHQMHVEFDRTDIARMTQRLAHLGERKTEIEAKFKVDPAANATVADKVGADMRRALKPIDVKINAVTANIRQAKDQLDGVGSPGGKGRKASIVPYVDRASYNAAKATLDLLTAPATKTIKVHMEENPTGDTIDVNRFLNSGLSGASSSMTTTITGTSSTGGTTTSDKVVLAPKTVPVKVYLDGEEIASHLDLEARRLTTVGVRRRA